MQTDERSFCRSSGAISCPSVWNSPGILVIRGTTDVWGSQWCLECMHLLAQGQEHHQEMQSGSTPGLRDEVAWGPATCAGPSLQGF